MPRMPIPGQITFNRDEKAFLPCWEYMGGECTDEFDGAATQTANLPADTAGRVTATIVEIRARAGDVYFSINAGPGMCNATSPGFVPENGGEIIGPLHNLVTIELFGDNGAFAHIMYFRENW